MLLKTVWGGAGNSCSTNFNIFCKLKCRSFIPHQRKGGIHAIYRIFMEAFG